MMPQSADTPPSPALLRADIRALLGYIHGARTVTIGREIEISQTRGWLVERFWFGIVVGGATIAALALVGPRWAHSEVAIALIIITVTARIGAIISIGRRLEEANYGNVMAGDAISVLASLGLGRNGLRLSLLSSNVFGLVIFALFASGAATTLGFSGGLFPSFSDVAAARARDQANADKARAFDLGVAAASAEKQCAAPSATPDVSADTVPADPRDAAAEAAALAAGKQRAAGSGAAKPPKCPAAAVAARDLANDAAAKAAASQQIATVAAIGPAAMSTTASDPLFLDLARGLGVEDVPNLFKLLLWAFVAGFAERLVPDVLNSLANRGKVTENKEIAAAKP